MNSYETTNSFSFDDPTTIRARVIACVVCLAITFFYWGRRRYSRAAIGSSVDGKEHDTGCNNPNCLRCHSSSRRHVKTFRANVTMLRRLVNMEPGLFDGMREEIWDAVEDMEDKFERQSGGTIRNGLLNTIGKFIRLWLKRGQGSEPTTEADVTQPTATGQSNFTVPMSPQPGQNPTVFLLPGLEAIPLHSADLCSDGCPCVRLWKRLPISDRSPPIPVTGDVESLRISYHIIRQELLDFMSRDQSSSGSFKPFDPSVYTHARTVARENSSTARIDAPEWSSIYLYHQGVRRSKICDDHFPQTARVLETGCPHLMAGKCGLASVYLSRLGGNTRVREHCGPTNARWRCHLPLVVPEPWKDGRGGGGGDSCLRVGPPGAGERRTGWEEGTPILFDDSFLHSAVYHRGVVDGAGDDSDGARIVLIVDFWHPSLSEADRVALGVLYPPGS